VSPRYRVDRNGSVVSAAVPRRRTPAQRFRSSAAWQRAVARQVARQPRCAHCDHRGSPDNPLTGDHIVPLALGGARLDERNLQTLCARCNAQKGAR
jgi:5-methylcytosine-specific restriction endonuclease McrA